MRVCAIALLFATILPAQHFEVASVRPSAPRPSPDAAPRSADGTGGRCRLSLKLDQARVDIQCATLAMLMGYAFRISPERISGLPAGLSRFDIPATIPSGAPVSQVPEMLQSLLADRFQLVVHRAPVTSEILALVVAKGGVKLQRSAASVEAPTPEADSRLGFFGTVVETPDGLTNPRMGIVYRKGVPDGPSIWEAPSTSLDGLADLLDKAMPFAPPVINQTHLDGRYALTLEVRLNDLPKLGDEARADMPATIRGLFNDGLRKLGLQLDLRKGPVDSIVVDHVEKTPTGN